MNLVELRVKASKPVTVSLPTFSALSVAKGKCYVGASSMFMMALHPAKAKKRRESNTMEQVFPKGEIEELNVITERLFYSGRLSFNLTMYSYYAMAYM